MSSFASRIAVACMALGACAAAAIAKDSEKVVDSFWAEREAEYRKDLRGPFTAIRADYLKPGESVVLYASQDSVGAEPQPGAAAIQIAMESDLRFLANPVQGATPATIGETRLAEARRLTPEDDLRLGRFLLSVDLQDPTSGRVLAYDPGLLAARFHGFSTFAHDEKLKVRAIAAPAGGETLILGTSRGLQKPLVRAATLEMKIAGATCRLTGYREPGSKGALFVPFRDQTSGGDSYGVGRYLRVEWEEGSEVAIVDFNHATNPWCAYSPYYNCILPPPENVLSVAIRAGEKAPASHP